MADISAPSYVNGVLSTENRTWNGVGVFHTSATVSVGFSTGAVMPAEYAGIPLFSQGWQAGATSLDAADKANIQLAYAAFSDVANITFTGFGNTNAADIRISTSSSSLGSGFSFLPGRDFPQAGDSSFSRVFASDFTVGGLGFFVALHEFGRAMGLKAPTEGSPTLGAAERTDKHTVMTAVIGDTEFGFGPDGFLGAFGGGHGDDNYATTLLLYDIAAVQWMYGANMSTRTGNDTYTFSADRNHMAIWDAGGIDTIDLKNQTTAQIVRLGAGQFSSIGDTTWKPGMPVDFGDLRPNNNDNVAIAFDVVIENATGGVGDDTIFGNEVANALNGWEGNDTLYGGAGADILNGWNGVDTLFGGAGDDVYDIGEQQDVVVEAAGQGYDIIRVFTSYSMPANVEEIAVFSPDDGITINGAASRDVLIGGDGANVLIGNAGDDWQLGMGGDDALYGGDGNDTLAGLGGADTLYGGGGNDVLSGDQGVDAMYGGAGSDSYFVDDIDDRVIETGDGYEIVYSFSSWAMPNLVEELAIYTSANVTVSGNNGYNLIFSGDGHDLLNGNGGDDTLWAMGGHDVAYGGAGADAIIGWTGDDHLYGGAQDDQIEGGEGLDTLYGGAGADILFGGAFGDADRFVITADTGFDAIRDFEPGIDRIDVGAFNVTWQQIAVSAFGAGVLLDIDGRAVVQVDNVDLGVFSDAMLLGLA